MKLTSLSCSLSVVAVLSMSTVVQTARPSREPDVPYVPTTEVAVKAMLKLADVKKTDIVYDLGCGDGRIVIAAAKDYGARGVGIDINPVRISEAKENARKAGVTDLVRFEERDLFEADIHEATVVTLFLLPNINLKLRPKLLQKLADELGMAITVCHYPPGTSKWNKVEGLTWKGQPLLNYETVVNLIGATKTKSGLQVKAVLDTNEYETGVKVTKSQMEELRVRRHKTHPDWNYTLEPRA